MTDADLIRFVEAQDRVLPQVEAELEAGAKRSHWMWFVFPQIDGLGRSPMAARYAIRDLDQARRYLADPQLGPRLRRHVRLMLSHGARPAPAILGTPDDLKFRSCVSLFREAAENGEDRALFAAALAQFYGGAADPRTLDLLAAASTGTGRRPPANRK